MTAGVPPLAWPSPKFIILCIRRFTKAAGEPRFHADLQLAFERSCFTASSCVFSLRISPSAQLEQGDQFGQRQALGLLDVLEGDQLLHGHFRGFAQVGGVELLGRRREEQSGELRSFSESLPIWIGFMASHFLHVLVHELNRHRAFADGRSRRA